MCGQVSTTQKQVWVSAQQVFIYAHWIWQEPRGAVYFALLHRLLLLNQLYLMETFHKRILFWRASSTGEETVLLPGPCDTAKAK